MTDNKPEAPAELREAYDRAEARAAEAEAAAQAAATELRAFKAQTLFGNEKHAELFLKANPDADVTPDAVNAFVQDYGLNPATESAPPSEPKPDPGTNLASLNDAAGNGQSGAAPAAQPKMSAEDFEKLLATNPQAAAEAYMKGTAPRNELNVQARDLVTKGIIDH